VAGLGVTDQEALPCPGIAPVPPLGDDRCMEMRSELVISAPDEDAWVVVGERFREIGEWASAITESGMDGQPGAGQVRTCHVAGFELGGQIVRTISAVMRFDTAIEVTTSQLRIELMFPADDDAEAYFRAHGPA